MGGGPGSPSTECGHWGLRAEGWGWRHCSEVQSQAPGGGKPAIWVQCLRPDLSWLDMASREGVPLWAVGSPAQGAVLRAVLGGGKGAVAVLNSERLLPGKSPPACVGSGDAPVGAGAGWYPYAGTTQRAPGLHRLPCEDHGCWLNVGGSGGTSVKTSSLQGLLHLLLKSLWLVSGLIPAHRPPYPRRVEPFLPLCPLAGTAASLCAPSFQQVQSHPLTGLWQGELGEDLATRARGAGAVRTGLGSVGADGTPGTCSSPCLA